MTCDARIRPLPDESEIRCEVEGAHTSHRGPLRDYAYPGSVTMIEWHEDDRRTFHGDWPGRCPECPLPNGHRGNHAP